MKTRFHGILIVCIQLALPALSGAEPLKVGVRDVAPFSIEEGVSDWKGLAVELWEDVAHELGLEYTYVPFATLPEMFTALEVGEIDIITSGISITSDREARFDFAHPFLSSNLAILARSESENRWLKTIRSFLSLPFLAALGSLSLVLLGAGAALYFFERKANPDQFSDDPAHGLGAAFWWAAVTMTTVGYGDKAPLSLGGRLVALVWMFLSVIILSTFTASIVSSLALPSESRPVNSLSDLRANQVATVKGSTADKLLTARNLAPIHVATPADARVLLESGQARALVFDKPALLYELRQYEEAFYLVDLPTQRQDYGFVLPAGSHLREPLNRELLQRLQSPAWFDLKARFLQ